MISKERLAGLVLSGGRARRMQTSGRGMVDKGLILLAGRPLIARACQFVAPQVDTLFISANQHHDEYGQYGSVVTDEPRFGAGAGPLAGVASVLAKSELPWLITIPVDVPILPTDLLPRLAGALQRAGVAYAMTSARTHPLCMLIHRDELEGLQRYLLRGGRKVSTWQSHIGARAVMFEGGDELFFNINSPADLAHAEELARLT